MRESLPVVNGKGHDRGRNSTRGALFAQLDEEANVQGDHLADVAPVPFALGVVPWKQEGVLRITVVVKATFLAKSSPMVPATAPQAYRISDAHYKNQPMARVISAADRVPRKDCVDVTVLGHAHASRGQSVGEMTVRVALQQGENRGFDKRLRVVGARMADDAAPVPFVRMPIVYERALGGIGTPENPIGCGEEGSEDDDRPNVLNLEHPSRPGGFGPIGAAWPIRKKRLGKTSVRDVESPLMVLPSDFDFSYFQSAPEDQQIRELAPDATLILEGFDPERESAEIKLPNVRALGAVYGLDAADPDIAAPIAFRADTLHIDADHWTATVTFRGHVEIRDESRLDQVVVATGIGMDGLDPIIPSMRPPADKIKPAAEVSPIATENVGGTLMLPNEALAPLPATPFAPATPGSVVNRKKRSSETLVLPLSSWSKGPNRHLSTATLALSPEAAAMLPIPSHSPAQAAPMVTPGPLLISPPPMMPVLPKSEPDVQPPDMASALPKPEAKPLKPEEIVTIEKFGFVSALLEERGAKREQILKDQNIDLGVWRKAERFWRTELKREMADGIQTKLQRFEEGFVQGWESNHPGKFEVDHYARLTIAEKEARIVRELKQQGIDPSFGMRLRRVWRRRLSQDAALAERFQALVSGKDRPSAMEAR